MILELFLTLIGLILLLKGGDYFVQGSCTIAQRLGISSLVIGLTVVAFGTSAPELFVTASAAVKGQSDFSIGNIVGSNLFNILSIIGIAAIFTSLPIKSQVIKKDLPVMLVAMAAFYFFSLDGIITRFEGSLLFISILLYVFSVYWGNRSSNAEPDEELPVADWTTGKSSVVMFFALVGMVAGAELIVSNATIIARTVGISEFVISATLAAIGTSLAELATTIAAVKHKQADLIVGNAVGSNIFNVFSVVGLTSLINPLSVQQSAIDFDLVFMCLACLFVWILAAWRKRFSWPEGVMTIGIYLSYVIYIVSSS